MSHYTVTKSFIESYHIRLDSIYCTWARINISEAGDMTVQSDCGDFSYSWRSFGESFKEFLRDIMKRDNSYGSYLYRKICDHNRERKLDVEASHEAMKRDLLEYRRENPERLSEEDARELWNALHDLFQNVECIHDFYHYAYDQLPETRYQVFGDDIFEMDYVKHLPDMQALTFCEVVAPVFAEVLDKELNELLQEGVDA